MYDVNEQNKINELKNVEIVDSFLHRGVRPTEDDMKRWSIEMISYYKQKSKELVDKGKTANIEVEDNIEMEDVLEEIGGIAKCMEENVVKGMEEEDEIVKLIQEEKLQVCVVLKTHLKSKKIGKICDKIFRRWKWFTNMSYCNKGCRIMVGWNDDVISIGVVHIARQSVLVKVETRDGKLSMYGSFIYASNSGLERKDLWKDLEIYKRTVGHEPWFLSEDLNVTLTHKEHSIGSSAMSSDMKDFQKCVNMIEVEDINSSGLFYTWTKNLHKIKNGGQTRILKKLDKVMGNEDFSNRMFKIVKNLKGLKKHLKQLAWCNGDVFENVKKLKEAMKDVQMKTDQDLNNHDLKSEESNVLKLYSEAMKDEEKILFQKAKVKWLSVRDRNNAYFHKTIKSRQQRNRIDAVCDKNGRRFKGNDVAEQFIKHFQQFLGESRHVEPISDMDTLFQCKLNSVEAEYMVREVSNEEIKTAMFQIDDNKAPGLDGYSATFFKKSWNIVGNDVCLAVKEFFETGKILREINSTLIALVPKIQTPLKVSDFRTIACCNVIYKYISKVLTKRLMGCLDKLVSKNQSAFIPNRHIQDNIMLAQELFKGYDRKAGPKRVVVKVDIQKAYDTVNWQFLESGRGLRQGDPISPYLFTLVMEILTLIIKRKVDQSRDYVKVLKDSIDEFRKVAGLIPNYNKSTVIFGCLDDEENKDMLEVIPFKVEKLPIRYLGVPLTSKRLRANECKSLLDKVESRVSSWKKKCLSYAGRIMLVAYVLETIHVYCASVFLLPIGVIEDINKLLKNFFWQQNDGTKGRAKVAWKNGEKWEVEVDNNDSWGWKNILSLRKDVRHFMFSKIGDGNRISVWYDNWSNIGTLDQVIKHRTLYDARSNARMTIKELVGQSNWEWPEGWTDEFPILKEIQRSVLNNDVREKFYRKWRMESYERNNRIFIDEMRSPDELYKILEDTIRMRLVSLAVKNSEAILISYPFWPWEETGEECLGEMVFADRLLAAQSRTLGYFSAELVYLLCLRCLPVLSPLKNVANEIHPNVEKKAFAGESSRVNGINDHRNSYTFAVKQKAMHLGGEVDNKPSIVLDDSCILQCDCPLSLMGKVQDFGSLSNLKIILAKDGFDNLILKYLGGFWVQIDYRSKPALEKFKSHVGVRSWFSTLQQASSSFLIDERVAWEDKDNLCLNSKRVCIKTRFKDNIFESFKIIVRGKVHWVRAKEVSGWVPDFMEDEDVEDESDEEIMDVGPKEGDDDEKDGAEAVHSEDPFNIYDLLRNKQQDTKNEAEKFGSTLKYPPGFTPVEDVEDNSDYEDKSIREENASNLKSHEEKDMSQRKNRKSMSSSKEEDKACCCSGHFKRTEGPQSGGSILQLLDDLVKYVCGSSVGNSGGEWIPNAKKCLLISVLNHVIDNWNGEVVIMGDFNEVCSKEERHGTLFNVHGSAAFNSFISLGGLVEVPLGGLMGSCPNISAITLDRYLSDHRPILLREKEKLKSTLSDIDVLIDNGNADEGLVHELEKMESLEIAQKVKIKWSIEGDGNSKYFHGILNKKRNQLAIRGILVDGVWTELNIDQQVDMERNVTKEEIKRAFWDCGTDKSSGPDGFTFGFYIRYWGILENDVVDAVSYFFNYGTFPRDSNSSFIALIPKKQDAKFVKEFRPISLIGSFYKTIAKILANRLVVVLGDIVNEAQSAFIANRQILDGPFIMNELIHWCKSKKKQTMIFKVDFEKAYDSVRWDYLDDVLKNFGFGSKWRGWIQNCLHSSRGSILVNGSPTSEFQF
ncbi:RNA-directed DNA polymerase, eukaryota, reverse transcriptase zinc-binding domain protein [Tanacetum coccineum]